MFKRFSIGLVVLAAVALGGWALVDSSDASNGNAPLGKGGGPPGPSCCDPGLEPGVGGNPFCFEGHTCCSSGNWQCNNPDGSPSCDPGEVCVDCAGAGGSCTSNDDCCSGKCKGNGTCK